MLFILEVEAKLCCREIRFVEANLSVLDDIDAIGLVQYQILKSLEPCIYRFFVEFYCEYAWPIELDLWVGVDWD